MFFRKFLYVEDASERAALRRSGFGIIIKYIQAPHSTTITYNACYNQMRLYSMGLQLCELCMGVEIGLCTHWRSFDVYQLR